MAKKKAGKNAQSKNNDQMNANYTNDTANNPQNKSGKKGGSQNNKNSELQN